MTIGGDYVLNTQKWWLETRYLQLASQLGKSLAQRKIGLVFGGGKAGPGVFWWFWGVEILGDSTWNFWKNSWRLFGSLFNFWLRQMGAVGPKFLPWFGGEPGCTFVGIPPKCAKNGDEQIPNSRSRLGSANVLMNSTYIFVYIDIKFPRH